MTKRALIWAAVSTKAQAVEDEKLSLPIQEADARTLAERQGWQVVDVLRVPGHSRFYVDIHECAADMLTEGIDAFDKLLKHWKARDFDVLIVRDGNRFARTQSLHAYVTEMTIRKGAVLWSLSDGQIDENNYRMWIAMNGYKAGSEVDTLVKRKREALPGKAKRGLFVHGNIPMSHVPVRDVKSGHVLQVVLDKSKRRLWDDAAALILEGVGWHHIERELFERFGHANRPGEPHQPLRIYSLINNPVFWGHIASGHRPRKRDGIWAKFGDWIFESGHELPKGVMIYYDVLEPVYTGELAEAVKAEVRRRRIMQGSTAPRKSHPFSNIFVCNECGYYMITYGMLRQKGKVLPAFLKCMTHWRESATRPDCSQRTSLTFDTAKTYIDKRLREMVAAMNSDAFFGIATPDRSSNIQSLTQDLSATEDRIRRLIRKQTAADDLHDIYQEEIDRERETLKRQRAALDDAERQLAVGTRSHADRTTAFEEIVRLSVDVFWEQEGRYINQLLHRLMGNKRLSVLNGKVVEIVDKPPSRRRPR